MTTTELIRSTEKELKRLEVRGLCEDDPRKASKIRKKTMQKRKLLTALRKVFGQGIERAVRDD